MVVRLDMSQVKRMFKVLPTQVLFIARKPLFSAADFVRGKAQHDYLRGPRPIRLEVATGRLRGSVRALAPKIEGKTVTAEEKASALSTQGFDYPAYWEWDGSRHGGPRPFLQPARDNHQTEWHGIFLEKFEKDFNAWERGKTY